MPEILQGGVDKGGGTLILRQRLILLLLSVYAVGGYVVLIVEAVPLQEYGLQDGFYSAVAQYHSVEAKI